MRLLFDIQIEKNLIIGQNQMVLMRSNGKTYSLLVEVKTHFEKQI